EPVLRRVGCLEDVSIVRGRRGGLCRRRARCCGGRAFRTRPSRTPMDTGSHVPGAGVLYRGRTVESHAQSYVGNGNDRGSHNRDAQARNTLPRPTGAGEL
ncbi:MAG: hypothetical protein AVDCRST_MAG28-233, partial [uncultured Rubrobacteraceae bacterium]